MATWVYIIIAVNFLADDIQNSKLGISAIEGFRLDIILKYKINKSLFVILYR
jgi:hypothetical protein